MSKIHKFYIEPILRTYNAFVVKPILAIESSCDETAVAILEDGQHLRANLISSQIAKHRPFGGIVPELASRCHAEIINTLIDQALKDANIKLRDIHAVAVTHGPGLVGALLVGMAAAKALSGSLGIPLVAVNHLKSHVYSNFLSPSPVFNFPYLILLVSGGHTQLIEFKSHTQLKVIAETQDDAAGEAFDKVARLLELGFPGGPAIQKAAEQGNPEAYFFSAAKHSDRFSFSGIKTAVALFIKKNPSASKADVAASFQKAVVDALVQKTLMAAEAQKFERIMLCGGVAANAMLRKTLARACAENGFEFSMPDLAYCTDNAAMVACAGYHQLEHGGPSDLNFAADPNLELHEWTV